MFLRKVQIYKEIFLTPKLMKKEFRLENSDDWFCLSHWILASLSRAVASKTD